MLSTPAFTCTNFLAAGSNLGAKENEEPVLAPRIFNNSANLNTPFRPDAGARLNV
jgi:hypothetical protein